MKDQPYYYENGTPYRDPRGASLKERKAAVAYVRNVLRMRDDDDQPLSAHFDEWDAALGCAVPFDPDNAEHVAQAEQRRTDTLIYNAREQAYLVFVHPCVKDLAADLLNQLALDNLA